MTNRNIKNTQRSSVGMDQNNFSNPLIELEMIDRDIMHQNDSDEFNVPPDVEDDMLNF